MTTATKNRQTKTHEVMEVSIQANSLLELQSILEQVHTAARIGNLDHGAVTISIEAEFVAPMESQSFEALEKVIAAQRRPWGVSIHGTKSAARA
jgi:hypothetical protein